VHYEPRRTDAEVSEAALRRATPEDWEDIRRLHLKLALEIPLVVDAPLHEVLAPPDVEWREFARSCAHDDDRALFVAHLEGSCVGVGQVFYEGPLARLTMLYVEGHHRRAGVATALVGALQTWAAGAGASGLVCHIPDVSDARALAGHLGWTRTDEMFTSPHGLQERRWTRTLGPGATERRSNQGSGDEP